MFSVRIPKQKAASQTVAAFFCLRIIKPPQSDQISSPDAISLQIGVSIQQTNALIVCSDNSAKGVSYEMV